MERRPDSDASATQPLTDSVWFWVALFALTGILLTWATSTRALGRRSQLVGRFYARQLSGLSVQNPDVAAQQPDDPQVAMGGRRVFLPIYAILLVMLGVAGVQLVRQRSNQTGKGRTDAVVAARPGESVSSRASPADDVTASR